MFEQALKLCGVKSELFNRKDSNYYDKSYHKSCAFYIKYFQLFYCEWGMSSNTGKGWASVLNTHWSRGIMLSSLNNK